MQRTDLRTLGARHEMEKSDRGQGEAKVHCMDGFACILCHYATTLTPSTIENAEETCPIIYQVAPFPCFKSLDFPFPERRELI